MDTVTHVALGACVGEVFFEKGFGKKAMLWGALAQSIPDIDFVSNFWMDVPSAMLAHRGFTHSLFFLILVVPVFSLLAEKIHRPRNIRFQKWCVFFLCAVAIHLFIDAFNNYGIGWLEPFSHKRFAFNLIYVADPLFSIIPLIALILLLRLSAHHKRRLTISLAGIIFPFLYLLICGYNKITIDRRIEAIISQRKIICQSIYTTPAPFQNLLWFVVLVQPGGFSTSYVSVFDDSDRISFVFRKKNSELLNDIDNHESLQKLIRFSGGYFVIERTNQHIVFNDLRFGQIQGWSNPKSDFVFQYHLDHDFPGDKLIIQRGRLKGWTKASFSYFIDRIVGQ